MAATISAMFTTCNHPVKEFTDWDHTHNRFTALLEFVLDHPGEQVQER